MPLDGSDYVNIDENVILLPGGLVQAETADLDRKQSLREAAQQLVDEDRAQAVAAWTCSGCRLRPWRV